MKICPTATKSVKTKPVITNSFQKIILSLLTIITLSLGACATIGKDFPVEEVSLIQIGKTTQKQVSDMFGSPWRTGLESGQKTWTYGNYSIGLFQEKSAKDLVIRFDEKNIVASYTFSTTQHEE